MAIRLMCLLSPAILAWISLTDAAYKPYAAYNPYAGYNPYVPYNPYVGYNPYPAYKGKTAATGYNRYGE